MPRPSNISKSDLKKITLIGIAAFIVVFSLKKEIVKEQETLKKDQALVASKSQLQARLASMQGKLKDYEKALPPYREMPNILQKIAEVAYESKVKIIKIEPLRTEKPARSEERRVGKEC